MSEKADVNQTNAETNGQNAGPAARDTHALIRLVRQGSAEAREQIVRENVGLIWSVVRRFTNRGYDPEDLFQVGAIGLLKCIDKFDLNYNVRFSTYAIPMIMGEIKRFMRDDGMLKVSRPLKELATKARYMQDTLSKRSGRQPTVSELALSLDVGVEELLLAQEADLSVESLYSTIHEGENGDIYLIDKLDQKDDDTSDIVDIIALRQIITRLSQKERQVIILRYFQDKTQSDVARELGVSQVQVSRIEKRVIRAMRESLLGAERA